MTKKIHFHRNNWVLIQQWLARNMALLNEKLGCHNFHLFEINNTQIFLPLLLKPCTYYCTCARAMPKAKKVLKRVPILKKTTVLWTSRSYYYIYGKGCRSAEMNILCTANIFSTKVFPHVTVHSSWPPNSKYRWVNPTSCFLRSQSNITTTKILLTIMGGDDLLRRSSWWSSGFGDDS